MWLWKLTLQTFSWLALFWGHLYMLHLSWVQTQPTLIHFNSDFPFWLHFLSSTASQAPTYWFDPYNATQGWKDVLVPWVSSRNKSTIYFAKRWVSSESLWVDPIYVYIKYQSMFRFMLFLLILLISVISWWKCRSIG